MSRDAAFHVGLYSLCVLIASIGSRSREILLPRRSPEEPESNDIEALNRFDYQAGHFRVNGAPPVEKLKRPCAGCGSKYRSCRRRQSQRTRHRYRGAVCECKYDEARDEMDREDCPFHCNLVDNSAEEETRTAVRKRSVRTGDAKE